MSTAIAFRAALSASSEEGILRALLTGLPVEELRLLTAADLLGYFEKVSALDDHAVFAALCRWCDGRSTIPRAVVALVRRLQAENAENAPNIDVLLAYVAPSVFSLTQLWRWSALTTAGAELATQIDAVWTTRGKICAADTDALAPEFWIDRLGEVLWIAERDRARLLVALRKGIRQARGQKRVVFVYWRERVARGGQRRSGGDQCVAAV